MVLLLCEALKVNPRPSWLILAVFFGRGPIDTGGACEIAELLKENSSLEILDMRGNAIGDDGVTALGRALEVNSTLRSLELASSNSSSIGISALANSLKVNSALRVLVLDSNEIDDAGIRELGNALRVNSTITKLSIHFANFGDDGVVALAKGLEENSSLTHLNIPSNRFGAVGADALAAMLKVNSTLTYLSVANVGIGKKGAIAFGNALAANSTLEYLDIRWCGGLNDGHAHAWEQNRRGLYSPRPSLLDMPRRRSDEAFMKGILEGIQENFSLLAMDYWEEDALNNYKKHEFKEAFEEIFQRNRNRRGITHTEVFAVTFAVYCMYCTLYFALTTPFIGGAR